MATILLISEDVDGLELVRSALVVAGHEVLVAGDASAVHRRCDLVLVDLAHADAAAQARRFAGKVVLFSEASEEVTRQRVQASGAQGYVRKLGPERLREDVQYLLDAA
jgi:DNA-binding response OmpR family regulator